jgi:hypothetical protein
MQSEMFSTELHGFKYADLFRRTESRMELAALRKESVVQELLEEHRAEKEKEDRETQLGR